jgi:hypothetical protein
MRAYIWLILICLNVFFRLNAQTGIAGNEQYNSYKQCKYIDNLTQKLTSDIFVSTYYSKLKTSDFKTSQIIDTIRKEREVHIRTKKARDGYLFVNKFIMDKVAKFNCQLEKMKISYVYNNKAVTTKKDVMRVLGLRKKCIQITEIIQDEQLGIITIYIIDK